MPAAPRYVDITADADAPDEACTAIIRELRVYGFAPLCAIRGMYETGKKIDWTVLVDEDARVAASVTTVDGATSLYVASQCADETILETQLLPGARVVLRLGPAFLLSDRVAKRASRVVMGHSVARTLRAHARLREKHARALVPWTPSRYLAFREASGRLITLRAWSAAYLAGRFEDLGLLVLGVVLAWRFSFWLALLGVVASMLALHLLVSRVVWWFAEVLVRYLPLRARERLARAAEASAK